jgi:hypothetical protein
VKIYFDLDGVLTDCHMSALRAWGVTIDEYPFGRRVKDIIDDRGFIVLTPDSHAEFWGSFDEDFWATLPKSKECDYLIDLGVKFAGQQNVWLASMPSINPESYSGKALWVQNNLPTWIHKQLILIHDKSKLAMPGCILVDDSRRNCETFQSAGGRAILYKRPWNGYEDMTKTDWLTAMWTEKATA